MGVVVSPHCPTAFLSGNTCQMHSKTSHVKKTTMGCKQWDTCEKS